MEYWEGSICGRITKIDYRYDIYRMVRLIRDFIQEHTRPDGYTTFGSDRFEEELEAYIYSIFPMIKVTANYGDKYFHLMIDYDDINYHNDVSNKVFDVLRGLHV